MKMRILLPALFVVMVCLPAYADTKNPAMKASEDKTLEVRPFDLSSVRLLDGPFKHAQELGEKILLGYDPNRLLSKFRTIAGLEPKAQPYGGWESQGIAGHSLGHYLSACALMYAATGDKRFKDRADYIVDELEACQKGNGNGYVMCVPRGKELFKEISEGNIRTQRFDLNGGWVPIYTLHKEMAGLRDAYRLCANQKALDVEWKLADWFNTIIGNLTNEQMQKIMYCEHGGIAETLADLSADTGEQKYMDMAKKFHHKEMMDPMIAQKDILSGYHGNTNIPKMIGLARIYELTSDNKSKNGAEFFWDRVVHHYSYVTGGHGLNEFFGPPDKLNDRLGDNTSETCNVYNMLKLTSHLFCWQPRADVADFYERALYNHILSSQNPDDGTVTYHLTLGMGGFKHFQNPLDLTCCVGTGMENPAQYGNSIYFHNDRELYVNLFIASVLDWKEKGITVTQDTKYPETGSTKLTIKCSKPVGLSLYIRHPYWAQKEAEVKINGKTRKIESTPSSFIKLTQVWKDGDVIEVNFPMSLRLETMPDNPKRVAIMYGPLVLAGKLGPVDDPKSQEPLYVPVLVVSDKPVEQWVRAVPDKPNTFMLTNVGRPRDVELSPFYKIYDSRDTIYWDIFSEKEWTEKQKEYERIQQERIGLEARTVDFVQPGEQQPEIDHNMKFENSNAFGGDDSPKGRRAGGGGWFSYDVEVVPNEPMILRISYGGSGNNICDVLVNGQKVGELVPPQNQPNQQNQRRRPVLANVEYKLLPDTIKDKNRITVKFAAPPRQSTVTIYGILTLKEKK
jgi:uncharacterized protein